MMQQVMSFSPHSVESWWLQRLRDGELTGDQSLAGQPFTRTESAKPGWEQPRAKRLVYKQYAEENTGHKTISENIFWLLLAKRAPFIDERKQLTGAAIDEWGQKVGVVKFAPLGDCLNFFARKVLRMPNAQMFKDWLHRTGQGTSAIPLQHVAAEDNHE